MSTGWARLGRVFQAGGWAVWTGGRRGCLQILRHLFGSCISLCNKWLSDDEHGEHQMFSSLLGFLAVDYCGQHDVSGLLLLRCRIARASSALRSAFRPIGWEESQAHFLYVYIGLYIHIDTYINIYILIVRIHTHTLFVFVSQSFASVHFCFILFAFLCSQGALQHRPDFCPFAWSFDIVCGSDISFAE